MMSTLRAWSTSGKPVEVACGRTTWAGNGMRLNVNCPVCRAMSTLRVRDVEVDVSQRWEGTRFTVRSICETIHGCGSAIEIANSPILTTLGRHVARGVLAVELDKNKIRSFERQSPPDRYLELAAEPVIAKPRKPKAPRPVPDVNEQTERLGAALEELSR